MRRSMDGLVAHAIMPSRTTDVRRMPFMPLIAVGGVGTSASELTPVAVAILPSVASAEAHDQDAPDTVHMQIDHLSATMEVGGDTRAPLHLSIHTGGDASQESPAVSPTPPLPWSAPLPLRTRSEPIDFKPFAWQPYQYVPEDDRPLQSSQQGEPCAAHTSKSRESPLSELSVRTDTTPDEASPDKHTQVTVVQIKFKPQSVSKPAKKTTQTTKRTHAVRLVLLYTPSNGCSTAYVHLLDLLTLIQRPCATTPLTMTNIQDKPHFTQLKCHMIQLLDEDIRAQLTSSSTTSVSMRSWLLNLPGLRELLQQPAIRKSVTTRVAQYGDAFETFLSSTLVNNLLVMNHGPQPHPNEPAPIVDVSGEST
jgi:hypothetical protein